MDISTKNTSVNLMCPNAPIKTVIYKPKKEVVPVATVSHMNKKYRQDIENAHKTT
jgi:hypothetical protein